MDDLGADLHRTANDSRSAWGIRAIRGRKLGLSSGKLGWDCCFNGSHGICTMGLMLTEATSMMLMTAAVAATAPAVLGLGPQELLMFIITPIFSFKCQEPLLCFLQPAPQTANERT